jgi:plastocyanin
MKFQEYQAPRLTLGVVGVIAILIPILLGYFLVSGMANSSSYQFPNIPSGATTTTTNSTSTAAAPTAIVQVLMPKGAGVPSGAPGYAPDNITVIIGINNTVNWTNGDTVAHTVTAVNTTGGNPIFNSGNMPIGSMYNYTFTTPGYYPYICAYHPWMTGSVTVKSSTGPPPITIVQVAMPKGAGVPSGAPGFAPDNITVVIGVNNTVNWTNDDTVAHTVTADNTTGGNPVFNSGNMPIGSMFNYTFTAPGYYPYVCAYHPWMTGSVTVLPGSSSKSSPPPAAVKVSMPKGAGVPSGAPGFAPDNITVVIGVNNTVTWSNNDTVAHTVTAVNTTGGNPVFNSGNMAIGSTFTYTFTTPGYYPYLCAYHPWMTGSVRVLAGSGSSSSASTSSSSTTSSSSSSSSAAANALMVSIPKGSGLPSGAPGFAPDNITLVIGVNNTVTWTNNDTVAHTVTSTSVPSGAVSFNSGNMVVGDTFTYTFTVPGVYQYDCIYHPWMTATITVVQG